MSVQLSVTSWFRCQREYADGIEVITSMLKRVCYWISGVKKNTQLSVKSLYGTIASPMRIFFLATESSVARVPSKILMFGQILVNSANLDQTASGSTLFYHYIWGFFCEHYCIVPAICCTFRLLGYLFLVSKFFDFYGTYHLILTTNRLEHCNNQVSA